MLRDFVMLSKFSRRVRRTSSERMFGGQDHHAVPDTGHDGHYGHYGHDGCDGHDKFTLQCAHVRPRSTPYATPYTYTTPHGATRLV